ncbi:hypothetical protein [uncultured Pedobacter sp.]|uniref:hypothetical protein n=1 Tax=uncultured Pedobacter sp. TaxID=246139 RepID=UPI0025CE9A1B|nr:hypothetical protein [uncultured Pedobacter sp.]
MINGGFYVTLWFSTGKILIRNKTIRRSACLLPFWTAAGNDNVRWKGWRKDPSTTPRMTDRPEKAVKLPKFPYAKSFDTSEDNRHPNSSRQATAVENLEQSEDLERIAGISLYSGTTTALLKKALNK